MADYWDAQLIHFLRYGFPYHLRYRFGQRVHISIMALYTGTDFILTFPTVNHITQKIKEILPGASLYEIDISHAFKHMHMDPHDYDC